MRMKNDGVFGLHCYKNMKYRLFFLLFVLSSYSNASEQLTLSEIIDLKNPYQEKLNDSGLVEDSKEFIHFKGLSDRFYYCKTEGMVTFIAFANHIEVMRKYDSPETKDEAMKYMAKKRNLEYPFNAKEIAESSIFRVDKLAIEMGWEHPGSSDAHLESVASIFWGKCLKLPINIFEAEWQETEDTTVYDKEGYDEDGYDEFGLTRWDNGVQ